jgi:tetratricopeptide (TPR) repeat protein
MVESTTDHSTDQTDKSKAQELTDQGRLLYRQGELEEALSHLHRAYELYKADDDHSGTAETANDIGVLYTVLQRHSEAEKWLLLAHRLFVDMEDYDGEAQTLGNIGSMFHARGDLKQAAANLQLASDRFHLVGDDERRSATLKVLSMVRLRQFRFLQALAAYEAALACHPKPTPLHKFLRRILSWPLRLMQR